jgi:hemerythrin
MHLASKDRQLSVGIRILDCDHREMSETIKDIQADLLEGKERERIGRNLRKLATFSLAHFALEEGIMSATKYPGLALHSLRHQRMSEEIKAYAELCDQHSSPVNGLSLNFVNNWHAAHVGHEDRSLGLWLAEID